ncbi:MAG TPA: hypothetical protein VGY66_11080 [Gemmataceae bacterium]|jgi:hypothetical protein|nr:hypothetical protein [Gemmataceae bacterium]
MPVQIPITDLIVGRWYIGRGRNGNVGVWDGYRFLVVAEKFEDYVVKLEPYYTEDSGCFQPFAAVDEGIMVEPFGKVGWDKHYGRRLEFGSNVESAQESLRKKIAALEPAAQHDLVGSWMGSTYLPDGRRIDHELSLDRDGTYVHRVTSEQAMLKPEDRERHGTWLHDKDSNLLIEKTDSTDSESRDTLWRILEYSGATMMLRWFAQASRNLPILFYRIEPVHVTSSADGSLTTP